VACEWAWANFTSGSAGVRLEGLHVQLDERGQRHPAAVGAPQHVLVEGQPKAARAHRLQRGDVLLDLLGRGLGAERGYFQHHFFRVDQLQVSAGQAVMRAIDEDGFLAHQRLGARIRQRVEQQRRIAGGGVRVRGGGPVEQFVAKDGALFVQDGLSCDDDLVLRLGGLG